MPNLMLNMETTKPANRSSFSYAKILMGLVLIVVVIVALYFLRMRLFPLTKAPTTTESTQSTQSTESAFKSLTKQQNPDQPLLEYQYWNYIDKQGKIINSKNDMTTVEIDGKKFIFATLPANNPKADLYSNSSYIPVLEINTDATGKVSEKIRAIIETDIGKTFTIKREWMFKGKQEFNPYYIEINNPQ